MNREFLDRIDDGRTASAFSELCDLYSVDTMLWLARLWDPAIGAFYYSNTARDYEGFLPDIESTAQTLRAVDNYGMTSDAGGISKALPGWMKDKLISFVRDMADPDGYFYHRQWGKTIPISRRGRDLGWAVYILRTFDATSRYPTALEILEKHNVNENSSLPGHLSSHKALFDYLESLDFKNRSYPAGNVINAQKSQIAAAGLINDLCDWLDEHQRADNGLWQEGVSYSAVSGLMKLGSAYIEAGRAPRFYEKAIDSAVTMAMSEERPANLCYVYNPLSAVSSVRSALRKEGKATEADGVTVRMRALGASLIRATICKAAIFRKPDGSFSMRPEGASSTSQSMPVSIPGTNEGDVNATTIAVGGVCGGVASVLEYDGLRLYDGDDLAKWLSVISESKQRIKKTVPEGVTIPRYDPKK